MSRRLRHLRAAIRLAEGGPRVRLWLLWDDAPYVCPGCHAIAPDPCLPGCIDDEIAREREDERDREDWALDEDDGPICTCDCGCRARVGYCAERCGICREACFG